MKTILCIFSCFLICLFAVFMMGMEGCDGGTTTAGSDEDNLTKAEEARTDLEEARAAAERENLPPVITKFSYPEKIHAGSPHHRFSVIAEDGDLLNLDGLQGKLTYSWKIMRGNGEIKPAEGDHAIQYIAPKQFGEGLVVVIQVTVKDSLGAAVKAAVAYFSIEDPVTGRLGILAKAERIQPL